MLMTRVVTFILIAGCVVTLVLTVGCGVTCFLTVGSLDSVSFREQGMIMLPTMWAYCFGRDRFTVL